MVQRECDRLQNLLDDFLNFAKVRNMRLEPSDLNEQVLRVLDFFRPKAEECHIEVFPYLQTDLPSVLLDREAFHGALLNLVLNAQQAMPGGGQLVVSTEATPRGLALHLIDTGCGMDDETIAKIFQTFYSTKRGGSGLGLPTAQDHRRPWRPDLRAEHNWPRHAFHDRTPRAGTDCRGQGIVASG